MRWALNGEWTSWNTHCPKDLRLVCSAVHGLGKHDEKTLAKRPNNRKSLETVVVLVNCWFWDLPNAICYDLWIWDRCFSWPAHIVPQGQCTSSKWGWQWTQVDFTSKISSFPPPTNPPARPTQHVLSLVACYESWTELCCAVCQSELTNRRWELIRGEQLILESFMWEPLQTGNANILWVTIIDAITKIRLACNNKHNPLILCWAKRTRCTDKMHLDCNVDMKYMATAQHTNGARSTSLESHYLSNEVELTANVLWFIAVDGALISARTNIYTTTTLATTIWHR